MLICCYTLVAMAYCATESFVLFTTQLEMQSFLLVFIRKAINLIQAYAVRVVAPL